MTKVKNICLFTILAIAIAAMSFNFSFSKSSSKSLKDLAFFTQKAYAVSEIGCISRPGDNNGDCTTDGIWYFCENSFWFHDCVKGEYP